MAQQQGMLDGFEPPADTRGKLVQKFMMPPFSVLDTRQGYWQERKARWKDLGIKSEIGRGENTEEISEGNLREQREKSLLFKSLSGGTPGYYIKKQKVEAKLGREISNREFEDNYLEVNGVTAVGTSIFDPVLCELMYRWFCPQNGTIYDPFAGGSVRGIVANTLGYDYHGIDLAANQIEANKKQGQEIVPDNPPTWYAGDSRDVDNILPSNFKADFIFSCPPYHDLEKYTDEPEDLSNMSWDTFKRMYSEIIAKAILKLNYNRFAVFVVSEIRDEVGGYKGFVPHTISSFTNGGMRYYNEIILVNTVGSLALRIAGQFNYRKIGRTHQNILVFYKGDIQAIPRHFKRIEQDDGNGSKVQDL